MGIGYRAIPKIITLLLLLVTGYVFLYTLDNQQFGFSVNPDEIVGNAVCSQGERKSHLASVCRKSGIYQWPDMLNVDISELPSHVLVDDKNKVIYCGIGKVASTAWTNRLAKASGNLQGTEQMDRTDLKKYGLRGIKTYSPSEIRYRLQHYFKFLAVRHPFARLASFWTDTFKGHKNYSAINPDFGTWAVKAMEEYTGQKYTFDPDRKQELNFEQMMRYIMDKLNSTYNPHWCTYNYKCKPCLIKYDHITRVETANEDSNVILNRLHLVSEKRQLEVYNSNNIGAIFNTVRNLSEFERVPQDLLQRINIQYGIDMGTFGYHFDPTTRIGTCGIEGKGGGKCC